MVLSIFLLTHDHHDEELVPEIDHSIMSVGTIPPLRGNFAKHCSSFLGGNFAKHCSSFLGSIEDASAAPYVDFGLGFKSRRHQKLADFLEGTSFESTSSFHTRARPRKMRTGHASSFAGAKGKGAGETEAAEGHEEEPKEEGKAAATGEIKPGSATKKENDGREGPDGKIDPLVPLPWPKLFMYRAMFMGGTGIFGMGAFALEEVGRRTTVPQTEKPPPRGRMYSQTPVHPPPGPTREQLPQIKTDGPGYLLLGDQVAAYDPFVMTQPLRNMARTIFDDPLLWQMQYECMFGMCICGLFTLEAVHVLRPWILHYLWDMLTNEAAAGRLTGLVKDTTMLQGFFLGLLTTATLQRNEDIWSEGIHKIHESASILTMQMTNDAPEQWEERGNSPEVADSVVVTRDDVVNKIGRWSRCSLYLLFHRYGRRETPFDALEHARAAELLTDEEHQALSCVPDDHPVAIWGWHFRLFGKMQRAGLFHTMTPDIWEETASDGLKGAQYVVQRMRLQMPFAYSHLICFMVKFSNMGTACTGGVLVARSLLYDNEFEAGLMLLGSVLMPLMTNMTALLNINLANPLSNHFTALSAEAFEIALDDQTKALGQSAKYGPHFFNLQWTRSGGDT